MTKGVSQNNGVLNVVETTGLDHARTLIGPQRQTHVQGRLKIPIILFHWKQIHLTKKAFFKERVFVENDDSVPLINYAMCFLTVLLFGRAHMGCFVVNRWIHMADHIKVFLGCKSYAFHHIS